MTNSITVNSPTTNSSNSTPSSSRPVLSRLHLPLKQCVLLVAAGEQEDFRSFSAPQKSIAAFGSLAVPASQNTNLLGHSPHLGGPFSRVGRADGLRAVFLLLACCYQEGAQGPQAPFKQRWNSANARFIRCRSLRSAAAQTKAAVLWNFGGAGAALAHRSHTITGDSVVLSVRSSPQ